MLNKFIAAAAVAAAGFAGQASAQACGGVYTVKPGDSLSQIADSQYKDAKRWSAIYNSNVGVIGDSPNNIRVGDKYSLPCINGLPTGLTRVENVELTSAPVEVAPEKAIRTSGPLAGVNLLTAGDYAPFTDETLPNGGLITDIVQQAMGAVQPTDNFKIHFVNDWAAHLDPLLSNAMLDLGFPWYQPDCANNPTNFRCENFTFSEPMFEILNLLFVSNEQKFLYRSDHDIVGKTLCRPKGYFTFDFEEKGRHWLRDGKITLVQPVTFNDCFEMLLDGEVDAVAANEFTGRTTVKDMGLEQQVTILQRPLSIVGLHVVVHKDHPQADQLMTLVNDGLKTIRDSGKYQQVLDTHMSRIWDEL